MEVITNGRGRKLRTCAFKGMSSMEAHSITQFGRGEALLITAGSKVPLSIIACKKEHELITTDRTELKALLEKKKREREESG